MLEPEAVATERSPLLDSEVGIWQVGLDLGRDTAEALAKLLAGHERQRAARFHFPRDATRFVVRRAAVRAILGQCLGIDPRAVAFHEGPRGRPELAAGLEGAGLQFSVSHSGRLALCAVTHRRRIGVDLERLRPLPDLEAIAAGTLSAGELDALRRLPQAERDAAFFRCWTRKEAYAKAIGEGLAYPLSRFTVSLAPGEPARLEHVDSDPDEAGRWTLEALSIEPEYAATVAVEGRPSRLLRFTWRARAS
jgi:4'-phosphopantetheinyl transferase